MPRGAAASLLTCAVLLHPIPSPSSPTGSPSECVPWGPSRVVRAPDRALGLFIPSALGVRTHAVVGKMGTCGSAARCSAAHLAAWSVMRWGRANVFRRAELTMMVMGDRSPQPGSKFVDQGQESAGRIEPPQESAAKQTSDGRRKIAVYRRDESQKTKSEWVVKKAGGGGGGIPGGGGGEREGASRLSAGGDNRKLAQQPRVESGSTHAPDSRRRTAGPAGQNVTGDNTTHRTLLKDAPLKLRRPGRNFRKYFPLGLYTHTHTHT